MAKRKLTIAIDGFSSCGKSTLAKDLANALDYIYIDSGAMYRAVTRFLLDEKIDWNDPDQLMPALQKITLAFDDQGQITLNGINVESRIRSKEVSQNVSEVAAISAIRRKLVEAQQVYGQQGGIVMDGRDIGSVVFPNAEIKLFLTADLEIRARRRYDELISKGRPMTFKEVKENLLHRDHIDSTREDSPLTKTHDAMVIDNSHIDRQEQLDHALNLIRKRLVELN